MIIIIIIIIIIMIMIMIIIIIMIVMLASAVASLFAQVYENGWLSAPKENLLLSKKVRTLDKIPN